MKAVRQSLKILEELCRIKEAIWIVRSSHGIAELRGRFSFRLKGRWATVASKRCPCHMHLDVSRIASHRFVQRNSKGGRVGFGVEFRTRGKGVLAKAAFPMKGRTQMPGSFRGILLRHRAKLEMEMVDQVPAVVRGRG